MNVIGCFFLSLKFGPSGQNRKKKQSEEVRFC